MIRFSFGNIYVVFPFIFALFVRPEAMTDELFLHRRLFVNESKQYRDVRQFLHAFSVVKLDSNGEVLKSSWDFVKMYSIELSECFNYGRKTLVYIYRYTISKRKKYPRPIADKVIGYVGISSALKFDGLNEILRKSKIPYIVKVFKHVYLVFHMK